MSDAAREAVRTALRLRHQVSAAAVDAVCAIDAGDRLGVEVRYVAVATLEGLYIGGSVPTVLVAADRPRGRQAMTVAHELAHHHRGDGSPIHTFFQSISINRPEERAANTVAAHFLMPRSAVLNGFKIRGFDLCNPSPVQILVVAGWLGVGYESLVNQLSIGFSILSPTKAEALLTRAPNDVRQEYVSSQGFSTSLLAADTDVISVDGAWRGRPVDLRVGDIALVPPDSSVRGRALSFGAGVITAREPGIGQLTLPNGEGTHFVRVMKRGYAGLARYRHLAPVDDNESGT